MASSATYLSEMAGRERRGFWSSFQYVTDHRRAADSRSRVLVVLQAHARRGGAARRGAGASPFAVGAVLAIVVFYHPPPARRDAELRECRAQPDDRRNRAARNLFRDHPREAFLVMALTAGGTLAFYAYTTYMQKFLVNTSRLRPGDGDRRS